jgi:hypothetical protein
MLSAGGNVHHPFARCLFRAERTELAGTISALT